MTLLAEPFQALSRLSTVEVVGTVVEVRGLTLRVADLSLPIGAMVRIKSRLAPVWGEVVGFDRQETIVMLLGETEGIRRGDAVAGVHASPAAMVGQELLGRVVDGLGQPLDGKGAIREMAARPLRPTPVDPLRRVRIDQPLGTGVRALDTMLTVGRGQRLGIFAGPGVGKSTLLSMMARRTDADVSVIALIGERGREVKDFIHHALDARGMERCVVVVATGDEPALMRIRAALYAHSIAEFFRDSGMNVLLLLDSVTRFAQAQRQVGLAAGEPPATKGYTPSVFAALPNLLERAGRTADGSITGLYTILVEGDDLTEPVSDACRGILDGHVILNRDLASKGHWPAIDVLQSISRVAGEVTDKTHQAACAQLTRLMSLYRDVEDLVNIGAYASGSNPDFDLAIAMKGPIDQLLRQTADESVTFDQARLRLLTVAQQIGLEQQRLTRRRSATPGTPGTPGAPAA
jgi:flagellum-specific ATP synthase